MTKEERKERAAKRLAEAKARAEVRRQDEALILTAMRALLKNEAATPEQTCFAVSVIDNLTYLRAVPSGATYTSGKSAEDLTQEFADLFKQAQ